MSSQETESAAGAADPATLPRRLRLAVHRRDQPPATVAVSIDDPDALVADLAHALGLGPRPVAIDGTVRDMRDRLGDLDLIEGSTVDERPPVPISSSQDRQLIGVAGGVDAGRQVRLQAEPVGLGRGPAAGLRIDNPTVSTTHADFMRSGDGSITVVDRGSLNGTWIGDEAVGERPRVIDGSIVRVGSSLVRSDQSTTGDRPVGVGPAHADHHGRILFNRPPRPPDPTLAPTITIPEAPPVRTNPAFSIASVVIPLIFAGVMIAVTGRWQYALFALLSPMMFIGNFVTNRRRVRRERRADSENHAEGVARLRRELAAAEQAERVVRRALAPDMIEVRRRVELPSNRLWERRPADVDAMRFRIGFGTVSWSPPLAESREQPDPEVAEIIAAHRELDSVELLVDLRSGPLGLVGRNADCAGVARATALQLATHHGPADLSVAVLTTEDRLDEWAWTEWLPHLRPTGAPLVLAGPAAAEFAARLLGALAEDDGGAGLVLEQARASGPGWLLVVDDVRLLHGRSSPTRRLLRGVDRRVFGVVIADSEDQLPASTATIAAVDSERRLVVRELRSGSGPSHGLADVVAVETATLIARAMARFEDPELAAVAGNLPDAVGPEELWGATVDQPDAVIRNWARSKTERSLRAVVGVGEAGPVAIDLVHDGPHGLVAGTTGAGKSEFLRTLVVGLATRHDPDDLVFVLIDYKGGSAFDCCARLPHVVGMVTDLDDHLAERALRSLEAELHRRERLLRDAESTDIIEYRRSGSPCGPLPRLVVIIDEFATLRAELPEFVAALVGIAQRGRSLGVHLILATQRPSGAVDANIRANTNLRVALRVQDDGDSTDVIDSKDAAHIDRSAPGRAFVRRGQGDLTPIQSAYVSGPRIAGRAVPIRTAITPLGSGQSTEFPSIADATDRTNLETLVDTIRVAATGRPSPRRPWLDDLEPLIDPSAVEELDSGDGATVVLAVEDDPERQRRVTAGWAPSEGHLAVYGALGSGVTTTLRSLVHRLGPGVSGRPVWVFAADHGAGGLTGIEDLPHVACRLEATEDARHARLLSLLGEMIEARRQAGCEPAPALPLVVCVIDGIAGFCDLTRTGTAGENGDVLTRIVRDGPAVGVVLAVGAARPADLPRTLAATVRESFALELTDPGDYHALGIRSRNLPTFRPGRALRGPGPAVCQIIDWSTRLGVDDVFVPAPPPPIERLPETVDRRELAETVVFDPDLRIPIGIEDDRRDAAHLVLRGGEHAMIAGPSGSGRTSALLTIARQLREADPSHVLVAVAPSNDAGFFDADLFDAAGTTDGLRHVLELARTDGRRWTILVDDADRVEVDETSALLDLARNARAGLSIIASGRSATVRQNYGHWLRHVRSSGVGILLNPDNGVDGELLAVRLPRTERLPAVPGRGYLVHAGAVQVVQIAT